MRIYYNQAIYGQEEIDEVMKVLSDPLRIGAGPKVREFEKKISALLGKKYGVMVNSGSSANLLSLELLDLPKGAEVITPILTFGTTLSPIVHKDLIPVFVDVEPGTYVVDVNQVEASITDNTKAMMIPLLFGNLPDLEKLRDLAKKYNLFFVEDSCDTLGAKFDKQPTGRYSDITTSSFYASHILTAAGGGGILCLNDVNLANKALVKSSWGRESTLFGTHEESEEIKKRFSGILDGDAYDAKFIFSEIGYNFQPTEIQGAFGLAQLKRYPEFRKKRQDNFQKLYKFFENYSDLFILPKEDERADTAWLAFPLTIKKDASFSRAEITRFFEEQEIQTRPVFTGNVLKHPAFRDINARTNKNGYPVTDHIMKNAFVIGCHHGMDDEQIDYVKNVFIDFLKKYK
ncbi:aminotransferase class I/II-fold pyridoxal phosphate-dependent enzyme [Candidatus Parcubacteria bacterium]|nr:aminotransferase class I/II-fold pyridoxal phosphate-dependent enzyme [Candidatus Parcubacteria bacterium]